MKKHIVAYCLLFSLCISVALEAWAEATTIEKPADILEKASFVEPLSTDAQKDEIVSATKELVVEKRIYSVPQTKKLEYQAFFLYHEKFNQGKLPVWIVYVLNEGVIEWKVAYGYNGYVMSLVPYHQDFSCYQLPNEDFWDNSYSGWNRTEELQAFADLFEGSLSFEQRVQVANRWRPFVCQWIEEHPYYLNNPGFEYTITMEEVYGIPDENSLSEQEAIRLAIAEVARMGANPSTIDTRIVKTDFYVTDPQNPIWDIHFSSVRQKGMSVEEKRNDITNTSTFQVKIHAYLGEVVYSHMESPL